MFSSNDGFFRNSPNLSNEIRLIKGRNFQVPTESPSLFTIVCKTAGLQRRRCRERAILARFSTRDMRDLGLSRVGAEREARKPF